MGDRQIRLMNIHSGTEYQYRVVLDTKKASTNYIERTTGVFYSASNGDHRCRRCMSPAPWICWPGDNYSKDICSCGQVMTLEVLACFEEPATTEIQ